MPKKFSFFRTFAWVLLLSFSATLLPVPALAEISPASASSVNASGGVGNKIDLSYQTELAPKNAGARQEKILLASQDKTASQAASSSKNTESDCCGGFWEIHFGGYRWAWWALAGTALIAIHAGAD